MNIQGFVMLTYVYQLIEGEVRAEKIEWRQGVGSCAYTKEHASSSDYLFVRLSQAQPALGALRRCRAVNGTWGLEGRTLHFT